MPRLKRKPRPLPPAIQQWGFLKAMAYFEGAWQRCGHHECRARKRCIGGPRGSFTRNDGIPKCRLHASPEWWAEVEKFGKKDA